MARPVPTIEHLVVREGDTHDLIVERMQPNLSNASRLVAISNFAAGNPGELTPGRIVHYTIPRYPPADDDIDGGTI